MNYEECAKKEKQKSLQSTVDIQRFGGPVGETLLLDDLDDPDHQPEPLEPGLQPFRYKSVPDDPFRYQ